MVCLGRFEMPVRRLVRQRCVRQRRVRMPGNASLKRSPAATALRCSCLRPTAELATRCALRSDSCGESVNEARKRAAASPALLGASEARCRASAHAFAKALLARHQVPCHMIASRQGWLGGGDLCGGEERRFGGGARSALRHLICRSCLSVARKARAASSAARPRNEHHSAVCAKRRPPQCEPSQSQLWREAREKLPSPPKDTNL